MKRLILILGVIYTLVAAPGFAQEAEAEEEEKEPKWIGSLGLAWVATSGNTDTSTIGLDFGLESKPAPWGFTFAARGNRVGTPLVAWHGRKIHSQVSIHSQWPRPVPPTPRWIASATC